MAQGDISRRKLNSLRMLQTDAFAIFQAIFPVIVLVLMRFQPSSTVHIDMMYNRFRFDPLSRAFELSLSLCLLPFMEEPVQSNLGKYR